MINHFIIIGTPKSGSSSLYGYLSDHPDTHLSKIKEYDFFKNMGYDWSRKDKTIRLKKKLAFWFAFRNKWLANKMRRHYFKSCYKKEGKVSGDGSVSYFYFPEVPKRIKYFVPQSKLILILRNPIDRVYSNYWMNYKQSQKRLDWIWNWNSFEDFIENGAHIKEINHYSVSLQRWLKYFKLNEILIITSEDFFNQTAQTLEEIETFLTITPYNYTNQHWVSPHAKKGNDYPEMKIETRQHLKIYFQPYVDELKSLTNIEFNWKDFE